MGACKTAQGRSIEGVGTGKRTMTPTAVYSRGEGKGHEVKKGDTCRTLLTTDDTSRVSE